MQKREIVWMHTNTRASGMSDMRNMNIMTKKVRWSYNDHHEYEHTHSHDMSIMIVYSEDNKNSTFLKEPF